MAAKTAGAVNPTVAETIPAAKPMDGWMMRLNKWYSPPERGNAVPNSLYTNEPHNAAMPPTIQSIIRGKTD